MPAAASFVPLKNHWFLRSISYIILGLFVILSGLSYFYFSHQIVHISQLDVHHDADDFLDTIRELLERDTAILRGAAGLYKASNSVERSEFYAYVDSLNIRNNYKGIYFIGFVQAVKQSELPLYIQSVTRDTSASSSGYPTFAPYPQGDVPMHYIVTYIYPETEFQGILGYDMAQDPKRSAAILKAIETNELTVTEKISVITDNTDAVLAFLPVEINGDVLGVVTISIQLSKFFTNVESNITSFGAFGYEIKDVGTDEVLYKYGTEAQRVRSQTYKETIQFGGRTWEITFFAQTDYGLTFIEKILPFAASEGILVIGVILFLFFYRQVRRTEDINKKSRGIGS